MKKSIFVILCLSILILGNVYAETYVCLDKTTGEVRGTIDIKPTAVPDWAKRYILVEADNSYQGLKHYEIKYENQILRKATQAEIDTYLDQETQNIIDLKKQDFLKWLDDADVQAKVKNIKSTP